MIVNMRSDSQISKGAIVYEISHTCGSVESIKECMWGLFMTEGKANGEPILA